MSSQKGLLGALLALAVIFLGALPLQAQSVYPTVFPKPTLILDQDRLFNDSQLGRALSLELALKRTALLQESREISEAFENEELRLTETRASMTSEEFRVLSDDFDIRVEQARKTQLSKDLAMQQEVDGQRLRFLNLSLPYLSEIMLKYFAGAIVDQRSVLLFNRDMDITGEAIILLDRAFDENPDMAIEKE